MYHTDKEYFSGVLDKMLDAARNGTKNEDYAENDFEAILFAQNKWPEAEQIILIADNTSAVREKKLAHQIKLPVRVIACGSTFDPLSPFQPDYEWIVRRTNGSIHTMMEDLNDLDHIPEGTQITSGQRHYEWQDGKFVQIRKRKKIKDR